jgi:ketosteroid isomerase-like protein
MSQENVGVVRDSLKALDDGGVGAIAEFWHPEISWRAIEGALDDVGDMEGIEAARLYVQDWLDTFDDFSVVPEELLDIDDDRVIAIQRASGRAKLSGIETQLRYAVLYALLGGRIVRYREYADRREALVAVDPAE